MKFADFQAGQVLEIGQCTVTESEIVEFAQRYDPQPFHMDKQAAEQSRWKGLIASGFHTCSLAMRMMVDNVLQGSESIGSPGLEFVTWPRPVRPGNQLSLRARVLETQLSKSGRMGSVRWQWMLLNEDGEQVLVLIATSLFSLRSTEQF